MKKHACRRAVQAALFATFTLAAPTLLAQAASYRFDLPSQPLGDALRAIGTQTGKNVLFDPELVAGVSAPALQAELTLQDAIQRLLSGTDLSTRNVAADTVIVRSVPRESKSESRSGPETTGRVDSNDKLRVTSVAWSNGPGAQGAEQDAASGAEAKRAAGNARQELEEVIVRSVRFHDKEATTAFKVPLSLKDTPQTVMTITNDVMDFAAIKTFQDVYKIDSTGGSSHRLDNFTVNYFRGFRQQSSNAIRIDGFRLRGDFNLDFAAFERLEVVKGATSTMYGQNSIAGTLNAISKMPKDEFGGEVKAEAGSFDHYRADADFYGSITEDGALAYRLVGAYLDEGSYVDHAGKESIVFVPTLRYRFGESTSVWARINYQKSDIVHNIAPGLQYLGNFATGLASGFDPSLLVVPDVPRSFFGGALWNKMEMEVMLVQASLEHRFDNGWMLRASAQHNDQDLRYTHVTGSNIQANGVPRSSAITGCESCDFNLDAAEINLFRTFEAFGREQVVFFGVDYSEITSPGPTLTPSLTVTRPSLFSPTYNTAVSPVTGLSSYTSIFMGQVTRENSGATAQLIVSPMNRLKVLLAGRFSHDDYLNRTRSVPPSGLNGNAPWTITEFTTDEVTAQGGLTYELTPTLNVYASYGETYEPSTRLIAPGRFIDPEEGELIEIGLKGELVGDFAYSLALFDMKRSGIAQSDPLNPPFAIPLGTQRSRGVELGAQGTVLPGWEVFVSLGVMEAKFIEGEFKGYRPENAPKFGASLFTSYEMQSGWLRGLGIGAGVVHKSGRDTFFTQRGLNGRFITYDFGDYTEVDLRLFKDFERMRLQVSATNLLDEKYYTPLTNSFAANVNVNPGRAVMGQVILRVR